MTEQMSRPLASIDHSTGEIRIALRNPANTSDLEQATQFAWALQVYQERNSGQRQGVWIRSGLKGQIVHIFAKAERAFWALFRQREIPDEDHFFDLMNYSAFALRCIAASKFQAPGPDGHDYIGGDWPW